MKKYRFISFGNGSCCNQVIDSFDDIQLASTNQDIEDAVDHVLASVRAAVLSNPALFTELTLNLAIVNVVDNPAIEFSAVKSEINLVQHN